MSSALSQVEFRQARGGRILYLTRNGLLEPLGQSQILAYLRHLASSHAITVITFEKPEDVANASALTTTRENCERSGIRWIPLRFRSRPRMLATIWNMTALLVRALWELMRGRVDLVHARSYLPAGVGLVLKRIGGLPLIFDMRAFWPAEMLVAGRLREGSLVHRGLQWLERRLLAEASAVVVLTEAAREYLLERSDVTPDTIEVIPTCADLELFSPQEEPRSENGPEVVVGCVGTVLSGWFLIDQLASFFTAVVEQRPQARLRMVTRDHSDVVRRELVSRGVPPERLEVVARAHSEVPEEIRKMDVGVLFFTPGLAKLGSSPTRMAEFLGCGVPCVANPGVGDVATLIERYDVGVVVEGTTPKAMRVAAAELLDLRADPGLIARCRTAAEQWFSLERGVAAYDALYRRLASRSDDGDNLSKSAV